MATLSLSEVQNDSGYLNQLKLAGNPYIDINTLPTVVVTLNQLTTFGDEPLVNGFGGLIPQSQYAETSGFSPMSSVTKVLQYLNDFFNPNTTDVTLSPGAVGTIGSASPSGYFVDVDLAGGSYAGMQFDVNPSSGGTVPVSQPPGDPIVTEPTDPIEVEVFDTPTKDISIIKADPADIDLIDISDSNPVTGGGGTFVGGGVGGFRDVRFDQFPDTNDFFNNQDDFTLREAQQGRVF
jgi:hypothetical protein